MWKLYKFNSKKICFYFFASIFCIAITLHVKANEIKLRHISVTLTWDTIPLPTSATPLRSVQSAADTVPNAVRVDTFSLRLSKDTLDAPIDYEAEDSAVLMVKEQLFLLYGRTKTTYKDIELTAPFVELNQQTNYVRAVGGRDSLGNLISRARLIQGEQNFQSDSILFNIKTQKALSTNTYTQEGEFFIKAGVAKKINENTLFVKEGFYTTCNYDDPHFSFKTNKLKVINNKLAVSGPTHPEFEGVPVPVYLPFGIFPLTQGRHSGLLPPQFTTNEQFGLGLEGLGYHHVLNDYVDVTLRGNIYSYGGWSANITPTYRKRYRYNGSFNLALQHTKFAFKGDPDYNLVKTFNISWNHSVDTRARPGTSFSASVNAGSTRHNQFVTNNPQRNFQNQLYSSISYGKQWEGKPYSLQLSANHNQNNFTHLIHVTLPDAGFTVTTLYPFQKKEIVGTQKWYEKIGVGYSGVARNQIAFYDTGKLNLSKIMDTLQWGARHSIPITLPLPPIAGLFFVNPSVSYEETWLTNRYGRRWNSNLNKVDTVISDKGLFIDRQMSFGLGFNTNVYGTFPIKNSKIIAIRHVMRPNLSINYKPNLSKRFFDVIQVDQQGNTQAISQFNGNLFSGYGFGRFGGMSFGVDNNIEMKLRAKDSGETDRKVRLIDGFGFNSAYNFLRDSQKLEPFNVYLRSTLFEKLNITAQALLDPYQTGPTGISIDRFVWQGDRFRVAELRNGSISMSTSFQSKPRDASKAPVSDRNKITDPSLLADQRSLADYMRVNPAEFVDFNLPWSINLSYSLTFSKRIKADYSGFETELSSNVSFSNSFSLTPKWNFTTNGYYDFNTHQLTMFTMSISRDMHCWQMSISATPIGNYRYFNITISPKASLLQDLRINRTRYFYNY